MKIPKNEVQWVEISDGEKTTHIITSKWPLRDMYYLYAVQDDGSLKKLGGNVNPTVLERKFLRKEKEDE